MRHSICRIILLILGLTAVPRQFSEACSCAMQHPQTHFCESDFVAVVRVKKFVEINDHESAYKVKIHRIFKATPKAELALKQHMLLWTPSMDTMCKRVNMEPRDTWVVGGRMLGGKPTISLCSLAMRWSEVTGLQRKGFRELYHRGCVCQISYTAWWKKGNVLTSGKRCLWESTPGPSDCQEKYGICILVQARACSWMPSVAYKNCIVEHQRYRDQQRARQAY